jgi:hypothetical protein
MRDQFLTPDAVRELHSRMGQRRRGDLTQLITDSFPAPFLSSAAGGLRGSFHVATVSPPSGAAVSLQHPPSLPLDDDGSEAANGAGGDGGGRGDGSGDGASGGNGAAAAESSSGGTVRFQTTAITHPPVKPKRLTVRWETPGDAPEVMGGGPNEGGNGRTGGNQCTIS